MMRMMALFLGGSVRMPRVFWGNVGRVLFRRWGGQQYPVRPPPVATGSNDNDR